MAAIHLLIGTLGVASLVLAAAYTLLALVAVLVWGRRKVIGSAVKLPAVTVFKPLCCSEPGLYEYLRTSCMQDYPESQLVLGLGDEADPALAVVARLVAEFPPLPIDVVIDPRQ